MISFTSSTNKVSECFSHILHLDPQLCVMQVHPVCAMRCLSPPVVPVVPAVPEVPGGARGCQGSDQHPLETRSPVESAKGKTVTAHDSIGQTCYSIFCSVLKALRLFVILTFEHRGVHHELCPPLLPPPPTSEPPPTTSDPLRRPSRPAPTHPERPKRPDPKFPTRAKIPFPRPSHPEPSRADPSGAVRSGDVYGAQCIVVSALLGINPE